MKNTFLIALLLYLSPYLSQAQFLKGKKFDNSCQKGDGLNLEYFSDTRLSRSIIKLKDTNIDFYLYRTKPHPKVRGNVFGARWTGGLFSPVSGVYKFTIKADDGMRIWIDNMIVIDVWKEQAPASYSFEVYMEGGQMHDIRVDYMQLQYDHAVAQVYWQYPGQGYTIVPTQYFYTNPDPDCYIEELIVKKEEPKIIPAHKPIIKEKKAEDASTHKEPEKVITKGLTSSGIFKDLPAKHSITLDNIYFNQGKYSFREDNTTLPTLNELVEALKKYPEVKIEISGHTDNVGSFTANMRLSRNRASKVVSYLVFKGIEPSRLSSKGYGSTQPIASNDTEEGKQKNRRVEVLVISD